MSRLRPVGRRPCHAGWRSAPNPRANLLSRLDSTYRSLTRPWSADELADRYHAALERGAADLPADEEPPDRPITLLATAIPRLISLAVATNILHTLPDQAHASGAGVVDELLATIDTTASGSLHRCHLALDAYGREHPTDTADEWLPYVCDETAHALHALSPTADPPSLIEHAQHHAPIAIVAACLQLGRRRNRPLLALAAEPQTPDPGWVARERAVIRIRIAAVLLGRREQGARVGLLDPGGTYAACAAAGGPSALRRPPSGSALGESDRAPRRRSGPIRASVSSPDRSSVELSPDRRRHSSARTPARTRPTLTGPTRRR
jgi:hypothetical protein